ncbi:hypothetical protein [Cellulosimicrobium sp. 22601]|uniref:hypothetical protein n=1 Tax=unclassified Cellulosimicrobium TaxID=2624466 RepID=UPI003F84F2CE
MVFRRSLRGVITVVIDTILANPEVIAAADANAVDQFRKSPAVRNAAKGAILDATDSLSVNAEDLAKRLLSSPDDIDGILAAALLTRRQQTQLPTDAPYRLLTLTLWPNAPASSRTNNAAGPRNNGAATTTPPAAPSTAARRSRPHFVV